MARARRIDVPNSLAPRVRELDGVSAHTLIERAERSVEAQEGMHRNWAGEQIDGMRRIVARLDAASKDERPGLLDGIARIAARLHDVGGTIGWAPLSEIGQQLYDTVLTMDEIGPKHRELIAAHADAMASVLHYRISDAASPEYRAVAEELARARRRLLG